MAGIKERLIQFILRGKDELSPEAKKSTDALEELRNEAASLNEQLDSAKGERGLVRDMMATQRALEQSQRVLAQTDESIKELRSALDANPGGAGLKQSLKDADREAARLRRVIAGLSSDLGEHEKAAKAAGLDTSKLADEEKRLAREVDDAKKALKANGQQLRELEREQARASRGAAEHASQVGAVREAMASGGRQILGYVAAYVSLNAVVGLVRSGLNLMSQGIRAVIADGSDKEQALAQLEATLRSTGNAAGFTAEQLLEMADGFEKSSMLTAEQVQAAQTRLLSYTDIVGDQFPKAMQIVIDQQQRLGISAEQSAEIVGRALQSPVEAMGALGRQGFKLEDGQKRLLQQLVATGKTAEAQTVIMNMMTEAYGGAAAAAKMNTAAGLWKTLTDQFGDFASRVSNSGAFEFVRNKLQEVSDGLDAMANDGRLDRLASGLSDAFIQGAQWVEKFARQMADVDFSRLADDSANWLSNFGKHLDQTSQKLSAFVLPFRALFNGLTSGLSLAAAAITNKLSEVLGLIEVVAERLPESLGGPKLLAAVQQARGVLDGMTSGFVAQVEQDGKDLQAAWEAALGGVAESTKSTMDEVTETIKLDTVSQADYVRQAVTSMQGALDQLSAAKTVAQLRQIGEEMYAAYQRGDISQQEYSATSVELNRRLSELGGTTQNLATAVGIAAESLKSLSDVQRAISDAKTDRDIAAIRTALQTLYGNAQITASEYNTELGKLTTRQKELAKAVQGGKKAQDDKNQSDKDAIVTSEQLRRESGKRMEAERQAGDAAMQQRRKESSDARKDMGAMAGFYDGVMNAARGPLASLSAAALEAFDRLRGIKTADMNIDTSSLDATTASFQRVSKALGNVRAGMDSPFLGSLGRWQLDMQEASLKTQQAYLGQQAQLQRLMESYERGSITTRQFESRARGLRNALGLLDDADLSSLDSAIKSAQDSMEQMGHSTRSTLESLQDELDGLQGRTEDIERRRFAARRRELEAQMAEANAGGDSQAVANAARALGMLRQIEAESAQQRQAEEQKRRQEELAKATPAPAAQPVVQQPSTIVRLELPGRAPVDVAVGSANDQTNLLAILEDAGLRTR
ncbi:phage tail length tape measure family protein [Pseudomonas sp. D2-3]